MFENPELAFEEVKAHDSLTAFLKGEGFEVEEHFRLATGFRVIFKHGKGGRTFCLNSELDALPQIGHGTPSRCSVAPQADV
jgi:metal-dependent amidase/aminoacylase/carboxypeptidase family protein